jgi:hypothetical protein
MLAKRLARYGLPASGGALAAVLSEKATAAGVPSALVARTIQAAGLYGTGEAAVGVISAQAAALTEGVLKTMALTKLKISLAVVMAFALVCGAGRLASRAQEGKNGPGAAKAARDEDGKLKETLLDLDRQMWDASTKGDTKVLRKFLAEDYLSIWALDDRTERTAALELARRYRYSDREMRDVEVRRVGQDAAVLTYVCNYKFSVDNEEPRALQERRVSTVWGKRGGRWVVVFAQAMSAGD